MFKENFKNCSSIKEAKTEYKKLARIHHPDKGGNTEIFKILNNQYNLFLDTFSNSARFETEEEAEAFNVSVELEKIISELLHIENIIIEIVGCWLWISGETKDIKDILKGLGFRWASKKKMWYFGERKSKSRKEMSFDSIKSRYKSQTVKTSSTKRIS